MYSDPFFVHANKMLKLLQSSGHLVSRTKTQSTAMSRDAMSVVMRVQAPKVDLVIKQFISTADPVMADAQSLVMKELSELGLSPGYIDYIRDVDGGPVLVYEHADSSVVEQSLSAVHILEGAQTINMDHAEAALHTLPEDALGWAELAANRNGLHYSLLVYFVIQSFNLRNSQPELAVCYERAVNTKLQ